MSFDAGPAVKALQYWYDPGLVGLYHWVDSNVPEIVKEVAALIPNLPNLLELYQQVERWWNSANAIGALIDYMATTGDKTYLSVLDNTFSKAQNAFTVTSWKVVPPEIDTLKYTNFLNRFYDDEGWWALAWIKAYDLTRDQKYLNVAVTIGQDMITGWDTTFANGGIYWGKDHSGPPGSPYKNAIANELFMAVTARLYLRTQDVTWKTWARNEYEWFIGSGLIWGSSPDQDLHHQPKYLINDSLNTSSGKNDGTQWLWTYNHGVILGALCDLSIISGGQLSAFPLAPNPLSLAEAIADAAIKQFSSTKDINGILREPACDPNCSVDSCLFKGVFIRNLAVLYAHTRKPDYRTFITNNATSVLNNYVLLDDNGNLYPEFGDNWAIRPPGKGDFVRQTAAIDAINAANRVLNVDMPASLKKALVQAGRFPPTGIRAAIAWLTPSVRAWVAAWTT